MNDAPKHVVSSTLDRLPWANSCLIRDNLAAEVTRLKQQPGKNILLPGSPGLVRSLLRLGLLDELGLMVHPIVAGDGMRLFDAMTAQARLELLDARTFRTGVVCLRYQTAAQ